MKSQTDSVRVIRCWLGDESYVFDMSAVSSVQQASEVRPTDSPIADAQIGVLRDASGQDVPVFALSERLRRSVNEDTEQRPHVVVTHTSRGPLGLLLGSVSHVLSIPSKQVMPLPQLLINPRSRLAKAVVGFHAETSAADEAASDELAEMCLLLSPERLHPLTPPLTAATVSSRKTASSGNVQHDDRRKPGHQPADTEQGRLQPAKNQAGQSQRAGRKGSGQVVLLSVTDQLDDPCMVGFSVTQIAEVRDFPELLPVPDLPSNVLGFVAWRNRPVPVIDLARRVGLSGDRPCDRLIIVSSNDGSEFVAFPAQSRMKSLRLPIVHEAIPVPGELQHDSVLAAFRLDSSLLVLPNLTAIMTC